MPGNEGAIGMSSTRRILSMHISCCVFVCNWQIVNYYIVFNYSIGQTVELILMMEVLTIF